MKTRRWTICGSAMAFVIMAALPSQVSAQDSTSIIRARIDELRARGWLLRWDTFFGIPERVAVINMIPQLQSNETNHDGEPNLAVDATNVQHLVGSAFTPNPTGNTDTAPVFVSTDGGNTWALRNIVPSANGMTGDISLDFGRRGGMLYTGILRGGGGLRQVILRVADPFTGGTMTTLVDHSTNAFDQPYASAVTTRVGRRDVDRVYFGFNAFDQRSSNGGTGRTASADFSTNARTAAAPAGFGTQVTESRNTAEQNMPATRFAVHSSGVIYGVFYRWASGSTPNAVCDIVVVRDDNFATGASPFTALTDPSDGVSGRIVVAGQTVPAFPASLGQNRLVASNLSIAVNPNNAADVWIAWADRDATTGNYTLHTRRSTDSGVNWSADLLTVGNATNPALAINSQNAVGFLYQQLTGTAPNRRWHTRLRRSVDGTSWSDLLLADVPDATGFMGDYLDLITVGRTYYGIFPATNTPLLTNFPQGVIYQRNADFTTNQLRNDTNNGNIGTSIDPFFFKVTPPTILDYCLIIVRRCVDPVLDRGEIIVTVDAFPTLVVDPIPKNCLVKWECPGCPAGLCPGWYHIYVDELDPSVWNVQVLDKRGELVQQQLSAVGKGIVLSFRPSKNNFNEKQIGDYYLTFESLKPVTKGRHAFPTRLEVDAYPQSEHLRRTQSR